MTRIVALDVGSSSVRAVAYDELGVAEAAYRAVAVIARPVMLIGI